MRGEFQTQNFIFGVEMSLVKKGPHYVEGYTNRTDDGKYTLFLDYDKYKVEWIEEELKRIADFYGLDHFFLLESSDKSYHVVSLCKMSARTFRNIIYQTGCDPAFRAVPNLVTYRSWVLRTFEKGDKAAPKTIKYYSFDVAKKNRGISEAHFLYMKKAGLIPKDKQLNIYSDLKDRFDGLTHIGVINYRTGSKILL